MPDETSISAPSTAKPTRVVLWRILALLVTVATVGAGALAAIMVPKMTEANTVRGLVKLMAATDHAQQALATELNEIRLAPTTGTAPNEELANTALAALGDAGKAVDQGVLGLANDTPGRDAYDLLTKGSEQLTRARNTAYKGRTGGEPGFEELLASGWVIQEAIPPALTDRDADLSKQAAAFVAAYRELPVPPIDPTGKAEDPHKAALDAMLTPANDDAASARTFGFGSIILAAVLAVVALVMWIMVLRAGGRGGATAAAKPATQAKAEAKGKAGREKKGSAKAEKKAAAQAQAAKAPVAPASGASVPPTAKPAPGGPAGTPVAAPGGTKPPAAPTAPPPGGKVSPPPLTPAAPTAAPTARPGGAPVRPPTPGTPSPGGAGLRPGQRPGTAPAPASGQTLPRVPGRPTTAPGPGGAPRPGTAPGAAAPATPPPGSAQPGGAPGTPPAGDKEKPGGARPRIPWRTTSDDTTKE
jgi:hypothetical protein